MITFKVEKMFKLPDAGGLKAFADVSINDAIIIRGVRLLEGKKGCFIAMPSEQGKDHRWYDQVVCKSTEVFDQLERIMLDAYRGAPVGANE